MSAIPATLTVQGLRDPYLAGELSPAEVVVASFERIRRESPAEIWITLADQSSAMSRAQALAAELARDPAAAVAALPLLGIPFAVKDNIDVAGLPTTAACPAFAHTPAASAAVVHRLEEAGAILIGKTNRDQFATGLVGTRSPYGAVRNPFDPAYISGGSSSGSAAAAAHGFVAFSLGTDTAGSGRVPAGFCNLVGIKPTPGLISTRGALPACRSLDCVSIFAHTVGDAWHVLSTLAGVDHGDPYSRAIAALGPLPRRFRIGVLVFGAMSSYGTAYLSGSPWIGLAAAAGAGLLLGALHGAICSLPRVNDIAVSIALMLFGTGLAFFLGKPFIQPEAPMLPALALGQWSTNPHVRVALTINVLFVAGIVLTFLLDWALRSTRWGLVLRLMGDNAQAARALGYPVVPVRIAATAMGGLLAGIGGAFLSLYYPGSWNGGLSSGQGLMAVALVIFARWVRRCNRRASPLATTCSTPHPTC